jgi:cyanophycinase
VSIIRWPRQQQLIVLASALLAAFVPSRAAGENGTVSPRLVICGGGAIPVRAIERFRRLAGQEPDLVVIPTASAREVDLAATRERWKSRGFDKVTVLHHRDRNVTSSADFSGPLRTATAVWFGGGSQQRIADAYLDTSVETELYRLLQRGGVIGGTSAGAAIQTRVMIAWGNPDPEISTGFDLLRGAIVDQHFLKRNRIPRLLSAVRDHPQLVGLGIDEGTALVFVDGEATVVGDSYVLRIRCAATS